MERMEEDMGIFICGFLCRSSVKRFVVRVVEVRLRPRGGDVEGDVGQYNRDRLFWQPAAAVPPASYQRRRRSPLTSVLAAAEVALLTLVKNLQDIYET